MGASTCSSTMPGSARSLQRKRSRLRNGGGAWTSIFWGHFFVVVILAASFSNRGRAASSNVASVAGLLGGADRGAYNASKHRLIGLTRKMAAEWGGRGLRFHARCPGL